MTDRRTWTQKHAHSNSGCGESGPGSGDYLCTAHIGGWHYACGTDGDVCDRWPVKHLHQTHGLAEVGESIEEAPDCERTENYCNDLLDGDEDKYPPWPDEE